MVKRKKGSKPSPFRYRRPLGVLILLVVATLLNIWQKIELAGVARQLDVCQDQIEELREEEARLTAAIVFKMKPGAIEGIARGRLEMDYPAGRLTELSFDPGADQEIE